MEISVLARPRCGSTIFLFVIKIALTLRVLWWDVSSLLHENLVALPFDPGLLELDACPRAGNCAQRIIAQEA